MVVPPGSAHILCTAFADNQSLEKLTSVAAKRVEISLQGFAVLTSIDYISCLTYIFLRSKTRVVKLGKFMDLFLLKQIIFFYFQF